jgi:hypothetical protein
MARSRHPKKEIEAVLRYAESRGWRVIQSKRGHRWGVILCPLASQEGCQHGVFSTPRSPTAHARDLRAYVDQCPHGTDV